MDPHPIEQRIQEAINRLQTDSPEVIAGFLEDYLQEARVYGDVRAQVIALATIGQLKGRTEEWLASMVYLQEAVTLAMKHNEHPHTAMLDIGYLELILGESQRSWGSCCEAITVYERWAQWCGQPLRVHWRLRRCNNLCLTSSLWTG